MSKDKILVGLLHDSVSVNTGDLAIGLAIQQVLAGKGFTVEVLNPFDYNAKQYSTIIVGGGQLLRGKGDAFYDNFRIPGPYILNGVGLSNVDNCSYLNDYKYVSLRSTNEAREVSRYLKKAPHVLPDITTLLQSELFEIPGLSLQAGEKVVGIHVVPEVLRMCPDLINIINSIPHKKVLIPFTHYNEDASFMEHLPLDRSNTIVLGELSPLRLHSVISQMSYVIVASLHATIFSFSQNVPFATMYQKKTFDYFSDRGLNKRVFRDQAQLSTLIESMEKGGPDFTKQITEDRQSLSGAIQDFEDIINAAPPVRQGAHKDLPSAENGLHSEKLRTLQLKAVVEGRDILLHELIYQHMNSLEQERQSRLAELDEKQNLIEHLLEQIKIERGRNFALHIKDATIKRIKNRYGRNR